MSAETQDRLNEWERLFNDKNECSPKVYRAGMEAVAEVRRLREHNEALYQQWLDVQDADNTWERYGLHCHRKWLDGCKENAQLHNLLAEARDEIYKRHGSMELEARLDEVLSTKEA